MERLATLVDLERRTLQVHTKLGRPLRRRIGAGAPPDALAQAVGIGLEAQQAGRVRKHRARVGLGEALAKQQFEEDLGVAPSHISVGHTLRRHVAEVVEAIDHLLGRTPTNAELQTTASDEIGGARILRHIHRILITHVDNRGADLDALGLGTAGREQRER